MRSSHTPAELNQAWVKQAQDDAERGVIECRMCKRKQGLDETVTVWRNGVLAFAVCDECIARADIFIGKTDAGIRVEARRRSPVIIGSGG